RWKQTPDYQRWLKDTGQISPADPDRRAAEYVISIGGEVSINDDRARIVAVDKLPKEPFRLSRIELWNRKQFGDTGMSCFKDCKNLTHLDLNYTCLSDAGLAYIKEPKKLTGLGLAGTTVSDDGLSRFRECSNLTMLHLGQTALGDAGLAHFKSNKNMETVWLFGTRITDAAMA